MGSARQATAISGDWAVVSFNSQIAIAWYKDDQFRTGA